MSENMGIGREAAIEIMAEAIHDRWFLGQRKWKDCSDLGKFTYRGFAAAAWDALQEKPSE